MMSVRIVLAAVSDAQRIIALTESAFDPRFGERWSGADIPALLSSPGGWGLLAWSAEHPDTPIGFLLARTVIDESEILLVAVDPAWRRRGIGERLLAEGLAEADRRGTRTLYLEVRSSNQEAVNLYRKARFEEVGVRPGYYRGAQGQQFDAMTMRMAL